MKIPENGFLMLDQLMRCNIHSKKSIPPLCGLVFFGGGGGHSHRHHVQSCNLSQMVKTLSEDRSKGQAVFWALLMAIKWDMWLSFYACAVAVGYWSMGQGHAHSHNGSRAIIHSGQVVKAIFRWSEVLIAVVAQDMEL